LGSFLTQSLRCVFLKLTTNSYNSRWIIWNGRLFLVIGLAHCEHVPKSVVFFPVLVHLPGIVHTGGTSSLGSLQIGLNRSGISRSRCHLHFCCPTNCLHIRFAGHSCHDCRHFLVRPPPYYSVQGGFQGMNPSTNMEPTNSPYSY